MPIKFGNDDISKIYFGGNEVSKIYLGNALVYEASSIVVDPVLGNNSWATIAQVCNAGEAADYWALGDTKTDLGTDGVTRTFRICDMSGMYGKNAVFEQVELTESGIVWNPSTNTDDNGCYNNYNISDMRTTALPALLANYSLELQAVITNTTYKVAKNGTANPMVLLDLTDKLFLPAEREIFASRSYSVQDEWNALTRFALYALPENDNTNFRMKFKPSTPTSASYYWERSPSSNNTNSVCYVTGSGNVGNYFASSNYRIAPVFALGVAPTPAVDPILENNSWETIKAVCEEGKAADYWNVGDTKNVTAGGYTRPVMIVDMSHGRTVFMFRNRTEQNYVWQPTAIDGYYNNYSTSQMRTTHLASGGGVRTELLDAELSAVLTASSYKVATNGNDGTLLTLSDELWLPAEKELTQTRVYSRQDEFDALTTFDYFIANDNNTARKCSKASAPTATSGNIYWERSPYGANTSFVCVVGSSGDLNSNGANYSYGAAPCFAFAPTPVTAYEIGFRGMSNSNPALTRTGQAVGATWAATSGVISIDGIDLTKIFGGYVGNDGEELTWDGATSKYLHNGTPYTGNVFVKINRFFAKAHYENNVLDGYDLCFAPSAPDNTYQDWFLGKDHCVIGCYKARGGGFDSGLQSKQGLSYTSSTSANAIVTAYKLNSSTSYNLHEKWYNENAILQVLFMAIFATKQTTDVFPQASWRDRNEDTRATGYMDSYRAQSLFAYEPTGDSGKRGNMFLGIEDFVGCGLELVAGVVLESRNVCPTTDYANFSYSNTYSSDLFLPDGNSYISELQESAINPGLLVPKSTSGTSQNYFCDAEFVGGTTWYQGASYPSDQYGVFFFSGNYDASTSYAAFSGRLCGKPL